MSGASRREFLESIGLGAATVALPGMVVHPPGKGPLRIAGEPAELLISSVSPVTVRLSLFPAGTRPAIPFTGALARDEFAPQARSGNPARLQCPSRRPGGTGSG